MEDVFVIGAFSTSFGKKVEQSYKSLNAEAYEGAIADAALGDGAAIESAWFGNTTLYRQRQSGVGGQVLFTPLVRAGRFPERVPITNVHNACATGSSAVRGAFLEIASKQVDVALAIGVEKLVDPTRSPEETSEMFSQGIDQFDPSEWREYYSAAGEHTGKVFAVPDDRSMFMETYAMQAAFHMNRFGTTQRQMAICAAKAHNFGVLNPRAQYRFGMTPEQVLSDREISYPLTRAMCAPLGDGAAALLLCSRDFLASCDQRVRTRAVRIRSCEMSGGKYRTLEEPGLSSIAAQKAYKRARVRPADIDVIEVHDATSFCEIYQLEMLGFCKSGEGGRLVEEGRTSLSGDIPVNTSGGLVAKGHPIGATGASMLVELVEQLRGEAGERQVANAAVALAESGGGVIGFDEAVCVVTILERA